MLQRIPSVSDEPPNANEDPRVSEKRTGRQLLISSDSVSDSEEEIDSALETTTNMIRPTRLGRVS